VTSSVSVTWTYTIDALSPAHKATNGSKATGLLIDWSAVTGASSYEIQSSPTQPFGSGGIVACATHAYTTSAPLSASTKYYWRARPINSEGIAGSWSDTFDFTTGP
jgi:hypothetical protein